MLRYASDGKEHIVTPEIVGDTDGYWPKFRPAVIQNVMVEYSPQSVVPAFYNNTFAPVFVRISLKLQKRWV